MATQNQDRLQSHFSSLDATPAAQGSGWDSLWEASTFLPWDRGYANPALIDLLSSPSSPATSSDHNPTPGAPAAGSKPSPVELPSPVSKDGKRAKVLVPGCGKGYDVALFSAYGYDAYGLEVSAHAAKAAEQYLANAGPGSLENEYSDKDAGQGKGQAVCLVGDFFDDAWLKEAGVDGQGGFDVIYDNTFLCALPPSLRPSWAKRISSLLSKNGSLICLEFPTHKPASSGGPPWSLPPTVHAELLKQPGEGISYDEGGVVVASERQEGPGALRRVAHYTPRRTHDAGVIKGVVRDSVSVWRHV
ncbi:Methyl halide transferase [Ascochyta rabiei]|uniref:S-adenosylmethionine-dependent methyltransferase n=1 Tax=Didymella rabiei TaxID=5454 RepID=A0A162W9J5_DIDRA|nr:Methyl halide transferase [Ascochyta rabiei]KZM18894.1 S-adenosylmethionine-dependent methyltransferase [Ascochyta rabiei]KZM28579.1 S-adenosylmethionine-dependent methyltransferase [Ascochyta rabiei]UPX20161.1 Methyl halide transferase [Ascochyta rabiei]